MPNSPEQEGSPRLMTISEIADEHGVSRQSVHTYRRRGVFPKAIEGEGSTRPRFREDEVAAFFAANPKRPGNRTDLPIPRGDPPMSEPFTIRRRTLPDSLRHVAEKLNELADAGGSSDLRGHALTLLSLADEAEESST